MFDKYKIYSWEKMNNLFLEQYTFLPYFKRIDKIKQVLSQTFKKKKKLILEKSEEKYDEKIEQAMYNISDPDKRRKVVVKWMDAKDKRLKDLQHLSRTVINEHMKQIKTKDLFDYYRELVTDKKLIQRFSGKPLDEKHLELMCKRNTEFLSGKKIEIEDTAALLYLKEKLFGLDKVSSIRNVVIDEAQDFSVFQLYALKSVLKTNLFTILGDISQGIHSYRGITDWKEVIDGVFPSSSYKTLQQSYRTTVEIMNVANQVIQQGDTAGTLLAKPVVRHGEKPTHYDIEHIEKVEESIELQVREAQKQGLKTIAIIGKTMEDCQAIRKTLKKKTSLSIQLLMGEEQFEKVDVVVVPAYIVKGLEFDVVIIVNVDAVFCEDELDIKLLYVAMTRPLHRLYIYAHEAAMPLLTKVPNDMLNRVKL